MQAPLTRLALSEAMLMLAVILHPADLLI